MPDQPIIARAVSAPPPPNVSAITPKSPPGNTHAPLRPSPLGNSGPKAGPSSSINPEMASATLLRAALGRSTSGTGIGGVGGVGGGKGKSKVLGIQGRLKEEVDGVVKRRSGGVLARGSVLFLLIPQLPPLRQSDLLQLHFRSK